MHYNRDTLLYYNSILLIDQQMVYNIVIIQLTIIDYYIEHKFNSINTYNTIIKRIHGLYVTLAQ